MKFDAAKFFDDFKINYDTHGPNTAPGWLNISCPWCDDVGGNHMGVNPFGGYANCWKCGFHPLDKTIGLLLGVDWFEAKKIMEQYSNSARSHLIKNETKIVNATSLSLPMGTGELKKAHKKYLRERNFIPKKLVDEFGIKGTTHQGKYAFRIIAPITFNEELVSYQGRDYTGKASLRYKACAKNKEVIHHKHLLYHYDRTKAHSNRCVVVEGISDVWRLQTGAVGTFGIEYKKAQMLLLAQSFETIFILYDQGEAAQENAERLGMELAALGKDVEILTGITSDDPGDLDPDDANHLMRELGLKGWN